MGVVRAMYARAGLALGVFRFADRGNFCAFEGTRGIRGPGGGGGGVGRAGRGGGLPVFFRTIGPLQGLRGYAGEGTPPCIMRPRCASAFHVRGLGARPAGPCAGTLKRAAAAAGFGSRKFSRRVCVCLRPPVKPGKGRGGKGWGAASDRCRRPGSCPRACARGAARA